MACRSPLPGCHRNADVCCTQMVAFSYHALPDSCQDQPLLLDAALRSDMSNPSTSLQVTSKVLTATQCVLALFIGFDVTMKQVHSSRLTILPFDVLHQILSLVIPSLPSTVHLNFVTSPTHLKLFRAPNTIPCPPILLVCRLLTRHALRMIYAQTRILIHPSRDFLTKLVVLKARKHVQHIDLAVELRPWRITTQYGRKAPIRSTHDLQIESFYSPGYVVGLILRTFPRLASIHLTVVESVLPSDDDTASPTKHRENDRSSCNVEVLHRFPVSSLTQCFSIDTSTWNDRITSLRYKTCRELTDLSSYDLSRERSPSPSPWLLLQTRTARPFFAAQTADVPSTNDGWRDRTRRLMEVASKYTNTTNPTERSAAAPAMSTTGLTTTTPGTGTVLDLDTGDSVTDFILQDEEEGKTAPADNQQQPAPDVETSSSAICSALIKQASFSGPPPLLKFKCPLPPSPSSAQPEVLDLLHSHILTRFSPFSPPTLPNLQSVTFYVTTAHSDRNSSINTLNGSVYHTLHVGRDGDVLRPKFEVLLSGQLFGGVKDIKVKRVVEHEGNPVGWEEMHEVDLARIFDRGKIDGRDGKMFGDW